MKYLDAILSLFSRQRPLSGSGGADFMAYAGDLGAPAFCVDLKSFYGLREAYDKCSPVSSIINKLSTAMTNGKWWIVDENDSDASKQNKATLNLFTSPNPLQTWTELIFQAEAYRYVFGEVFFYFSFPVGFSPSESTCIWVISPGYVEIEETGKLYNQTNIENIIKGYALDMGNERIRISPDEMLHIKDSFANLDFNPRDLRGKSRITTLEYEVRNIIQAQEAIYSLNKDRGAQGIITNKSKDASGNIPLTPAEKEKIQYELKYGLSERQKKVILADVDLGWQQMSFNVKDLMLFEGIKANIENVADAFNYPFELLANQKGTTFDNKSESEKIMYQDAIIPFSKIYAEKFTNHLDLKGSKIVIDFSEVECLREAEKEKAEALKLHNEANEISFRNKIVTREEWREIIGMDQKIKGNSFYENGNENGNESGNEDGNESGNEDGQKED
ncbi:MAG: phage portal protein [Tannerella sp.]|jgi:phage portal protein BeeE|nr:phage portal protein [Tannerella sp.]